MLVSIFFSQLPYLIYFKGELSPHRQDLYVIVGKQNIIFPTQFWEMMMSVLTFRG